MWLHKAWVVVLPGPTVFSRQSFLLVSNCAVVLEDTSRSWEEELKLSKSIHGAGWPLRESVFLSRALMALRWEAW